MTAPFLLTALAACAGDKGASICSDTDRTFPVAQTLPLVGDLAHDSPTAIVNDLNGDGYDDVLSGSRDTTTFRMKSHVYFGSATGLGTTPGWTKNTAAESGGSAGDVNADGFGDLLLSADYDGHASLYLGSAAGPGESADLVVGEMDLPSSAWLFGVGDVDGDDFDDLVSNELFRTDEATKRTSVWHGSVEGASAEPSELLFDPADSITFGRVVSGAGDVDGDGRADIVVGDADEDVAYLFTEVVDGGSERPTTLAGADGGFGFSVGGGGDVNGDGYDDMMVSAPLTSAGSVYLYLGSTIGIDAEDFDRLDGRETGAAFGAQVSSAADFDGDGYDDVLVGTLTSAASYVFGGAPDGIHTEGVDILSAEGTVAHESHAGGDVNGDGWGDALILTRDVLYLGEELRLFLGEPCVAG